VSESPLRAPAAPEPDVKARLRELGVAVPRGVSGTEVPDASALRPPLVLKAFGPGIVHKSDVGAVQLGLRHTDLAAAAADMRERLTVSGFLVEEQCASDDGLELIVGVVRREPFGLVAALGLGGALTELLDLVALRTVPVSERDARELVSEFPGAGALEGARGRLPVDCEALVRLLLAIAGPDGLASQIGDELAELECNPVLVTPDGAVALDARLLLREPPEVSASPPPPTDFSRLFAPRAIAVAGASTTRAGFGNRALAAYRAAGWTGGLYALHPEAEWIDGVPAYSDVRDIEDAIDYLFVAVPASRCADLVRASDGRVPFVHVISGGFDEIGSEGQSLSANLVAAAREVKTRVIGPNCIGVYCPAGRQTFQLNSPAAIGHVSVISQSGGLSGDIINSGARRGVLFSKVVSVGNAIDVTPAELLDWLVDDPETSVVGLYLEGAARADRLVDALRRARGRKHTVLLIGGQSEQGAEAVVSHTGALAGERRVWEAIARSTDAAFVRTLDEFVGALAYIQRWSDAGSGVDSAGGDVLVVGPGGGASVLATDACDRAGLVLEPTSPAARARLLDLGLGAGTSVANPLEIPFGPAVPVDALRAVLVPLLAEQQYSDVLVHVNVSAYYGYGTEGIDPLVTQLRDLATAPLGDVRIAVVLRNVTVAPGRDAGALVDAAADSGLVTFPTLDEAAVAIAANASFRR
jgi:acyl-CoA synthetase (NDP forming)